MEETCRFSIGDSVAFYPVLGDEAYIYDIPPVGAIGKIIRMTANLAFLVQWGVYLPMYEIAFEGQEKNNFIYEEDLKSEVKK